MRSRSNRISRTTSGSNGPARSGMGSGRQHLNYREARSEDDERHIAPLQLGTIERCIKLWSNPGDLVLSPFAGIGSEGYVSLLNKRCFVGIELKPEYWKVGVKNLKRAESDRDTGTLLDLIGP